ncbi:hypothetical protein ABZT47_04125 [Sphaerisporangium sp. NPDC005289]|uniref:hypothetical protein n=1 Tax=Sphaerisporangium sp. NPDC005289 TaxID=3155247 RepID=UPI0033BC5A46
MQFDRASVDEVLVEAGSLGLISEVERSEILSVLTPEFPYADALKYTDSVHAHIKVEDVDQLPHAQLKELGYRAENAEPGYIKYSTDAAINLIFSSIPIAKDDQVSGAVTLPKPFMDHVGIDMRDEATATYEAFEKVPDRAAELGWREVPQGGATAPVHCCHTQVKSKHWVYPPEDWKGWRRPIEFAFGTLVVFDKQMGCDLRPMDPAHPLAQSESCCGAPATDQASGCAG